MRKVLLVLAILMSMGTSAAFAQSLAGMPMKHKMAGQMECSTCHGTQTPFAKPASEQCIACHGPMANIKTKENPQGKNPHQSAHYADTVECSVCHSEHQQSKDLCSNCHKVQWQNFR